MHQVCKEQERKRWPQRRTALAIAAILIVLLGIWLYAIHRVDRKMAFNGHSSGLKQTLIVPTLDTPMPPDKNVIWCSSFQLAWNELRDDIIKEPVKLTGAQEIADRLNNAEESIGDAPEESVYATAGFVKDGIAEQIRTQMKTQFPAETLPTFESHLPEAIIAFCYLMADITFGTPYIESPDPITFQDAQGDKTRISAFGITKGDTRRHNELRRQMEVLLVEQASDGYRPKELAIDLDRNSKPNQIVLACVPPKASLAETFAYVHNTIETTPKGIDSPLLRFGRIDRLLLPNLFWKIEHNFTEIEGRILGNAEYTGYWIEQAFQMIQFDLNRTGVQLKSEAKISTAPAELISFTFNRPFLIYMKKRGATHPYFVMWVANAELLDK